VFSVVRVSVHRFLKAAVGIERVIDETLAILGFIKRIIEYKNREMIMNI